jgi:hypothetical protein
LLQIALLQYWSTRVLVQCVAIMLYGPWQLAAKNFSGAAVGVGLTWVWHILTATTWLFRPHVVLLSWGWRCYTYMQLLVAHTADQLVLLDITVVMAVVVVGFIQSALQLRCARQY